MGQPHGAKAKIFLDDLEGACQQVSGDTNSITFTRSKNNPETTTLNSVAVSRIDGLRDASLDVTCVYDDGGSVSHIGGLMDSIYGASGASAVTRVQLAPAGCAASLVIYTACMLLNNYAINTPVDGVVTLNFSKALASGSITAACQS